MNDNPQKFLGFLLVIVAIVCLIIIYLFFDKSVLIPRGYSLAIDGFVLSKNLLLFLIFVMISQLGYFLIKNK